MTEGIFVMPPATTGTYALSLHDALPISAGGFASASGNVTVRYNSGVAHVGNLTVGGISAPLNVPAATVGGNRTRLNASACQTLAGVIASISSFVTLTGNFAFESSGGVIQ